jgi:hypothetical protein
MSDPVLNEEYIAHLLSAPATKDYTDALQAGSVQTLLDLRDRGVTRDEFIQGVAQCLGLYAQLAKLWMLHNIKDVYDRDLLDDNSFEQADRDMRQIIRKQVSAVNDTLTRLKMCPTSKDKVH